MDKDLKNKLLDEFTDLYFKELKDLYYKSSYFSIDEAVKTGDWNTVRNLIKINKLKENFEPFLFKLYTKKSEYNPKELFDVLKTQCYIMCEYRVSKMKYELYMKS